MPPDRFFGDRRQSLRCLRDGDWSMLHTSFRLEFKSRNQGLTEGFRIALRGSYTESRCRMEAPFKHGAREKRNCATLYLRSVIWP